MKNFTISSLTIDDFPQVFDFWHQTNLHCSSYEEEKADYLRMLTKNPDTILCIKDTSGKIISTVFGTDDGRRAMLHRVATLPEYRNLGMARKLINKIMNIYKQSGIPRILARVHVSNTDVISFYKKLNFNEDDTILLKHDL